MTNWREISDDEIERLRAERKELYKKTLEKAYEEGVETQVIRDLALSDIFFLGVFLLDMRFADNNWVFARCNEFSQDRDGYLDLWPREHFKSTIITLWAAIQEILRNPEITIGIFSFNRPIAKAFLRAIKWQFEMNAKLKELFSDILWDDPQKEAPKWSEDDGIVVKRKGLPKEMTVEAWGLVDGQPTSKHYMLMIYDDIVTVNSVSSPEMIAKVTEAVSISFNLGSIFSPRRWMVGTIYHYADTYSELVRRNAVKVRHYGATKDGEVTGEPWFWSRKVLAKKIEEMGPYVASCQLFNKPIMEGQQTFRLEWIRFWRPTKPDHWSRMNRYILVDPATEKKDNSDYTVMGVIGLGADRNYYLIDMIRDRLSLQERASTLFALHRMYHPMKVGYEKYGMQSDIEYIKEVQEREQYRFPIIPLGGSMKKNDRIRRIQPFFADGRFYLPESLMKIDYQGQNNDLVQTFIKEEYLQFPYMSHDDMLDMMARITEEDLHAGFPAGGTNDGVPSWLAENGQDGYDYDTMAYLEGA